jgi:hypothetical protein
VDTLAADIVTDPAWFPMRFDVQRNAFQFARVAADMHRAVTFLSDIRPTEVRALSRNAVASVAVSQAPLHLIVHSGLGGSTLLARALAQPGVVTTLKEPPILTDVIAFGLKQPDAERELLGDTARLLARPLAPREAVAIKLSSIGNGLAVAIAEDRADSQVLCLQTPLELMRASLASRGAEGRTGGRRLFTGMRNARMIAAEPKDAAECSDLELTALAWLSMQKMMLDAAAKLGPQRVRSLPSERLIGQPRETLKAIADHFRLDLDVDARLASGVFTRHAKTGETFDAESRQRRMTATLNEHGAEIEAVVQWTRKVADTNQIAWDLPNPLMV